MIPARSSVIDLEVEEKHLARIRGCIKGIDNENCLELYNVLLYWRKNTVHGDGSLTFKLSDFISPYGMSIDLALWCVSFYEV